MMKKNYFKRTLATLLCAASLLGMAACGQSTDTDNTNNTNTPNPGQTGTEAGADVDISNVEQVFYLASTDVDNTASTTIYPWSNLGLMGGLMYRSLFLAESDLTTLNPDLAESHSISEDGLTYTFHIVEDALWSDGTQLTAKDVVFSIKTVLKVSKCNAIYTNLFTLIEGAEAWREGTADDLSGLSYEGNVVTMTLSAPYAATLPTMAQFVILPEHRLADANPLELHNNVEYLGDPCTSGPYALGEINPGNYTKLVLNENYNGKTPNISEIIIYSVSDLVTQAQAGMLDYINTNVAEELSQYQAMSHMTMHPIDILFYRYFTVNMEGADGHKNEAMQDIRVRQAILHAVDREAVAQGLFPDLGHSINSGIQNADPLYNGYEYDYNPEKAKQLLAEAGYDMNRPIRILYYYGDQTTVDFMDALTYYLGEVGLKVEAYKSSTGTQDLFVTRNYDIGYKGLSAFNVSEWYGEYVSTHANFSNIMGGDTRFDELVKQLGIATTESERNNILSQLQELEQESLFKIPFYTLGNNIFINSDRVALPDGVEFGNPWYRTNIQFEDWKIIQ